MSAGAAQVHVQIEERFMMMLYGGAMLLHSEELREPQASFA